MSVARGERRRLVQVTDCHLLADPAGTLLGIPTLVSFRMVVEEIFERLAPIEALVLTGDLSQDGSLESYLLLRDVIGDYPVPAFCLPGNHDRIEPMREVLNEGRNSCGPLATVGDWRLILLDSRVPGHDHGELGEDQFRVLDGALNERAGALVFVHHPPVALGCPWLDAMGLRNGPRLLETLSAFDRCRAVAFGHAHQEFDSKRGALRLCGTPATCFQFKPCTTRFELDPATPGCRVFDLFDDGGIETFVHRLPVFPFRADRAAGGY
jgi:Icc protein